MMILLCALFILQGFNDKKVQVHKTLQVPLCFMRWMAFFGVALGLLFLAAIKEVKTVVLGVALRGKKTFRRRQELAKPTPEKIFGAGARGTSTQI